MATETQEQIDTPKERKVETTVRAMRHDRGDYSVSIVITNAHINFSTSCAHLNGSHSDFAIFDLTVAQMKKLGQQIIEAAIRMECKHER